MIYQQCHWISKKPRDVAEIQYGDRFIYVESSNKWLQSEVLVGIINLRLILKIFEINRSFILFSI